ncbi:MAG: Gfo/Idh/MocA family oxidoreductase [Vicinamibacterales bacterium]
MKILVAGLGSIGQRHVRNLRTLLGGDVEILAYRVRGRPGTITESMTIDPAEDVEAKYHIRSFDRLDTALAERPDAVLVCNPTSLHLVTALAAVRAGCHVLVEKPLADSLEGVDELIALAERQGVIVAVGYQMRSHPALVGLRDALCRTALGQVTAVRAEFGEYLPAAHPYEDYRQSYAARAALGGGVLLCYIHEFDYLCWLFGMPRRVFTVGGRSGSLDLDVEDHALTTMECGVNGRPVTIELRQDFLRRPAVRTCEVIGDAGTILVDLNAAGFERNQLFLDEMRHFLAALAGADTPLVGAREASRSLRVALAARQSLASGQAVELS